MDQNATAGGGMAGEVGDGPAGAAVAQGDEDLVVDSLAVDAAPDDQPQQQMLYSLDQAILHSVECCCKWRAVFNDFTFR